MITQKTETKTRPETKVPTQMLPGYPLALGIISADSTAHLLFLLKVVSCWCRIKRGCMIFFGGSCYPLPLSTLSTWIFPKTAVHHGNRRGPPQGHSPQETRPYQGLIKGNQWLINSPLIRPYFSGLVPWAFFLRRLERWLPKWWMGRSWWVIPYRMTSKSPELGRLRLPKNPTCVYSKKL